MSSPKHSSLSEQLGSLKDQIQTSSSHITPPASTSNEEISVGDKALSPQYVTPRRSSKRTRNKMGTEPDVGLRRRADDPDNSGIRSRGSSRSPAPGYKFSRSEGTETVEMPSSGNSAKDFKRLQKLLDKDKTVHRATTIVNMFGKVASGLLATTGAVALSWAMFRGVKEQTRGN